MANTTADELFQALESLRPDPEERLHNWYIGRREAVLDQVLERAASDEAAIEPTPTTTPPRKPLRRRVLASGLAIALLGGGTAWALSNYAVWYTGGAVDDVTCMTAWHDPFDVTQRSDQYGGPGLSTDPIADCNRYAELTGKPRIEDPVAVKYQEALVVGPRAGQPADAIPVGEWQPPAATPSGTASPTEPHNIIRDPARELELANSLEDRVDGGNSRCWSADTGSRFARAELQRLGFADWQVNTREQEVPEGDCAFLFVPAPGTVEVRTRGQGDPATSGASEVAAVLRREIADQCLNVAQAEAVVARVIDEGQHHWPTSVQIDPEAPCSRVDLVYGGSRQVFLYGPEK